MVLVSVTFPTMSEARRFSKKLVRQRLAACVNIHPIESIYWWKGKLVHTQEA
ncbi:MAG TPA: divalent-cation tolerance protein CutA, partial [Candidatus Kerfeldbacteria bacterium]|nr:divalent-cation tolerance protein CutA [Candidatus Kerfeldbacteria bacterium]